MCGRMALFALEADIAQQFGLVVDSDYVPSYNIAPGSRVLCLAMGAEGVMQSRMIEWGLRRSWAKENQRPIINARIETVREKPSFRDLLATHRCCVLASGYYEWQAAGDKKLPFYFYSSDQKVMVMAGLWSAWRNAAGGVEKTCVVLTCAAEGELSKIHHRMPLILCKDMVAEWLMGKSKAEDERYVVNEKLKWHQVTTQVNKPSFNNVECVKTIAQ